MSADWQTLQDLGILASGETKLSVFEWANRTPTQGGAGRLKERFRAPLSNPGELRRTQAAVRFLAERSAVLEPLLRGSAWLGVERYAKTSLTALDHPNALFLWLDSWWSRWMQADTFDFVRASLMLARDLAGAAGEVADRLREAGPPALLATWLEEVATCLDAPALAALRQGPDVHRLSPPRLLALDRALRDDAFGPLLRLARLVYEIDALAAMAAATAENGLVFPEIVEGERPFVEAEGVYHPLLDRPVSNPFHLSSGTRLVFLTGPNMAGKSTYLRACGVAIFLAQLGMGVPARRLRFAPFDHIFTGIDTADDLRLGHSFFYREVRRVREAAEILAGGGSALMIFDEMFKGTNLKDASDACLAVLSGFASSRDSAFLVASHLAELAEPIEKLPGARFLQFGARVEDGVPAFDYRIGPGVSEQRLGMLILRRERVLALLGSLHDGGQAR